MLNVSTHLDGLPEGVRTGPPLYYKRLRYLVILVTFTTLDHDDKSYLAPF